MNPQSEAYLAALADVYYNYEYKVEELGPDYNNKPFVEKLNYQFVIRQPTLDYITTKSEERNKVIRDYTDKETVLFDQGDIENLGSISQIWSKIANPDGTNNSNYGYMVYHIKDAGNPQYNPDQGYISQWEWARERLKQRQNTNQAILHFNRPKDQWFGNQDQPCTVFTQFTIRNNVLHFTSYMRSNDLVYGTPYNISYFIKLMYRMRDELKDTYPGLQIGNLTHNATSIHIYLHQFEKVKQMLALP